MLGFCVWLKKRVPLRSDSLFPACQEGCLKIVLVPARGVREVLLLPLAPVWHLSFPLVEARLEDASKKSDVAGVVQDCCIRVSLG